MKITDLQPHPIAAVFPLMPEEELEALARDISVNGLKEPIVIVDGLIIDGRNRLEACLMAGVKPKFILYDPEKHGSIESYVLSKNIHRRQMNKSQVACVAHLLALTASESSEVSYTKALGNIIADMGVSKRYVDMAADAHRNDPHFFNAIYEGGASLYDWEQHKANWTGGKETKKEAPKEAPAYDLDPAWDLLVGTKGRIVEGDDAYYFEFRNQGVLTRCFLSSSSPSTEAT